ncbi:MAG: SPOR domain-containing protein [Cyanobacteria bacterium SIG30]|nr:SPOR domain-containing protein [Cyanobacteria bacterium SIG30]
METPDYLAYKKAKQQYVEETKKAKRSDYKKLKILFLIFSLTFIFCFLTIMNVSNNLSTKLDIEEEQNVMVLDENNSEEQKGSIDKRLEMLYDEEIGLSTARAINKKEDEIMSQDKADEIKKSDEEIAKTETVKEQENLNIELNNEKIEETYTPVFTRVLVGKYATIEEAKSAQDYIRTVEGFETASPFIRKMGDFYSIQVGSYTNSDVAKSVAEKLSNSNYHVWILEN